MLIVWFLLWFSYSFITDLRKTDQNWHPLLQLRIFLSCLNKTFSLMIQPKDLSQSLKTIMNLMWFLSNFHSQNDLKRNRLLSHYLGFFLKISKSFSWQKGQKKLSDLDNLLGAVRWRYVLLPVQISSKSEKFFYGSLIFIFEQSFLTWCQSRKGVVSFK